MEQEKKPFYKKWWVIGLAVFFGFGIIVAALDETPSQSSSPPPVQTQQTKQISYQTVDRWTIPNGGEGKAVVISPEYLNEMDMVALGEKIKNDTQNDRNAFISVFDNASAAALRNKVLADEATTAEQELYDKHFIAKYTKNGNTGFHEFVIFFDGVMGTNHRTIAY
ncbi:hypothetical protein HYW59_03370 [Candidatus Kaiserbacteria bacterium]|nr:hypothetical protein [Candidatus Kaiserbacteria bacterium]